MGKVVLRQSRSIGDRIPAVFQYFVNEWKGLLAPFFIYVAPVLIIILGYTGAIMMPIMESLNEIMAGGDPEEVMGAMEEFKMSGATSVAIVLLSLLSGVLSFSIFGSYMALREDSDDQPSARAVFSNALPKMLPVFVMLIISGLAIMAGSFLFIIGALIVLVFLAVAYPVIFMEDANGIQAIGRSFQLCKKNFFDTLGFFVILVLVVIFTSVVLSLVLTALSSMGLAIYEANKVLGIILIGIVSLINQIVNVLIYIGQFLHYGHVVEKTENNSLENEIMAL